MPGAWSLDPSKRRQEEKSLYENQGNGERVYLLVSYSLSHCVRHRTKGEWKRFDILPFSGNATPRTAHRLTRNAFVSAHIAMVEQNATPTFYRRSHQTAEIQWTREVCHNIFLCTIFLFSNSIVEHIAKYSYRFSLAIKASGGNVIAFSLQSQSHLIS